MKGKGRNKSKNTKASKECSKYIYLQNKKLEAIISPQLFIFAYTTIKACTTAISITRDLLSQKVAPSTSSWI